MLLVSLPLIALVSCQKNDTSENLSNDFTYQNSDLYAVATDITANSVHDACVEDVQGLALMFSAHKNKNFLIPMSGLNMKFMSPHISSCASISESDTSFPKTIKIDYGTGCTSHRGHVKKGKIIVEISDSMLVAGSIKTVRSEDFYVDNMKIDIAAVIKNMGKNNKGNWVVITKYDEIINSPSGNILKESYCDTTEWLSGFETVEVSDDVFYKSGSGVKTLNDSIKYSHNIILPLLYDRSCESLILSGIIDIYRKDKHAVIDYGNGTCDNIATVTYNDTTETIDLKRFHFQKGGHFERQFKHRKDKGHGF